MTDGPRSVSAEALVVESLALFWSGWDGARCPRFPGGRRTDWAVLADLQSCTPLNQVAEMETGVGVLNG